VVIEATINLISNKRPKQGEEIGVMAIIIIVMAMRKEHSEEEITRGIYFRYLVTREAINNTIGEVAIKMVVEVEEVEEEEMAGEKTKMERENRGSLIDPTRKEIMEMTMVEISLGAGTEIMAIDSRELIIIIYLFKNKGLKISRSRITETKYQIQNKR
jgi:hypothetical protein